jgi:hypothetical protein
MPANNSWSPARAVGAVLVAQLEIGTDAADQRVPSRDGGVVEAHVGKLAAADDGGLGKTEHLAGEGTGRDDQAGHGDAANCMCRSVAQPPARRRPGAQQQVGENAKKKAGQLALPGRTDTAEFKGREDCRSAILP